MNSKLLMSKIIAKGHDRRKLAEILGISYWTVCQKLTNKYEFTHREMSTIIKEYDLTAEEIKEIFFN